MFKKLIIALMLTAAPFAQAKAVLVCSMMNSQLVEDCCCDHERRRTCAASENAVLSHCCCVVTIDASEEAAVNVAAGSAHKKPFENVGEGSPDHATGLQVNAPVAHPVSQTTLLFRSHTDNGSRLYLLTARLRL